MVDGAWHDEWYDTGSNDGRFIRADAQFRHWVTADGSPGPSGEGGFAAEPGRYHLYISNACPWAHRTRIMRTLKGLADWIGLSVVHWHMGAQGWTIVNNESSEIMRMFNSAFDALGATPGDYYPAALRDEIDAVNARVYDSVNNGVYKCGFATSQLAYDEAIEPLFDTLDWLDARLAGQRYLVGETLTEADWRLFTTLIRFDPVYVGHFKCNKKRLIDYPNLSRLARELYAYPGVAETVNMRHIKHHYYGSHETINPSGVVPAGPAEYIGA